MVSPALSGLRREMNGEVKIEGIGIHTHDMMDNIHMIQI